MYLSVMYRNTCIMCYAHGACATHMRHVLRTWGTCYAHEARATHMGHVLRLCICSLNTCVFRFRIVDYVYLHVRRHSLAILVILATC